MRILSHSCPLTPPRSAALPTYLSPIAINHNNKIMERIEEDVNRLLCGVRLLPFAARRPPSAVHSFAGRSAARVPGMPLAEDGAAIAGSSNFTRLISTHAGGTQASAPRPPSPRKLCALSLSIRRRRSQTQTSRQRQYLYSSGNNLIFLSINMKYLIDAGVHGSRRKRSCSSK